MINHLRTLLLNQSGVHQPGLNYPGEELVPVTYNAKSLPFGLATSHALLFGSYPDRAYQNWRLRQYLPILHDTPLVEAVLELDRRITYLPFDRRLYAQASVGPEVIPQPGTTDQLYVVQTESAYAFRAYYNWVITVIDGTTVELQDVANPSFIPLHFTESYTVTDGLSNRIPLPMSPYSVYFQPTAGDSWTVSVLTQPKQGVNDVYALLKGALTDDCITALFGSPSVEPYLSFRKLWETNPFPSWQLGGLLLALGYRINEL